ncbi:histidine kinase [Novosphingobium profundi]|uniref:ATP-binding protein n=1 Tax=Novosphingobium profundi TaxID=1774954 RepID=UPI001BDB3831|nr:ATP-binding protein [Novosphingobium profundi]MBT0667417.1 histidine kinase [Novosphingobium profundi]
MLTRLKLDGLRLRIGAIVFLHALLVYLTLALFSGEDLIPTHKVYMLPAPDRVEAIVLAFERARPSNYPDLIRALDDDRQSVRIIEAPARAVMPDTGDGSDLAAARASNPYREALGPRAFWIEANGRDVLSALDQQPIYSATPYRVLVLLANGRAVEIVRYTTAPVARFLSRRQWLNGAILVVDLLIIALLAAQSTVPVARLLRAVRRDDISLLPLRGGAREFRELALAFRAMREGLRRALDERTRIVAAVAHDFRTYLTRLELRTDFIEDARQRTKARLDLDDMRQMMDDVFVFARPDTQDADEMDTLDGIDVAKELAPIVEARKDAGENVSMVARSGSEAGAWAHVSRLAFRRMMANLLDNALRYGQGAVIVSVGLEGDEAFVCVEDDGPGVPEEHLASLTAPFRRLETSRARHTGGVGLGLSIVEALAHRFGGWLELENRRQGGFRACLRLRRALSPTPGPCS